jgi:beta-glucosidase/6-phospho-beta-glucosidase/beta-galactosidase
MFRSFFFAGFECATGYNSQNEWIDQVAATHHDLHADEDYRRLNEVGIHAAREAIRWPLVDRGNNSYDFSSVEPFLAASLKHNVEVVWDLFHYGYPPGLDLFSDDFPARFAAYCEAAARFLCERGEGECYFTPVNEPSYFAWAAGDVGLFAPHATGRGPELKKALARAAIAGINAIRSVSPSARIVNVDPICHVVAPQGRPDLEQTVNDFNNLAVFESWDMLCGRLSPELGGSREHLDIVGMNYYWTNQWELGADRKPLEQDDPRLVPLRELVRHVWARYGGELLITETTHVSDCRPSWVRYVAQEAEAALSAGIPLRGVCLYPILGMPEWHERDEWVTMGLWDIAHRDGLARKLCKPMLEELRRAQRLNRYLSRKNELPNGSPAVAGERAA